MGAEQRLRDLRLELPDAPRPVASYVPVALTGNLAFVSGMVPLGSEGLLWSGKLGRELGVQDGAEAAKRCALQALAALRAELGSLDRVRRIVKVTVFVSSVEGFIDQPKVANGASDLFIELFEEAGRHARAAVAAPELPLGAPVEVEQIAEIGS